MSKSIDLNAPWSHPNAIDLDNQSVRSYLEQHVRSEDAREVYDKFVTLVTAVETTDLSVLDWIRFLKAGYGFSSVQNTSGGAQEARIIEGMQEIPIRLAETLGRGGVAFKNQVVNIKEENNGAYYTVRSVVTAQDGSTRTIRYTSRYVIVTLPPHLVGKIEFTPKLSLARCVGCKQISVQNNCRVANVISLQTPTVHARPNGRYDQSLRILQDAILEEQRPEWIYNEHKRPGNTNLRRDRREREKSMHLDANQRLAC
jgi:monoamine oxidase